MILEEAGAVAEGVVLEASAEDRARLDFYEGGFAYGERPVTIVTAAGPVEAQVFFPEPGLWTPDGPFDIADWQERWGAVSREAAREAMEGFGRFGAAEMAARFPVLRARAQARVNAAAETGSARADQPAMPVEVIERAAPFDAFFRVETRTLRFPHFAGGMSAPVSREVFVMTDATTVLPYDPIRDRVLLIEQFRVGPFARGDAGAWLLEPIAGRIDGGETAEKSARREALEEAGLELRDLHLIARQYPSAGAVTEFLHSYVGTCDLPDERAGIGGLASEHEDIRSHIIGFDRVLEMANEGLIRVTPLLMSIYWLALNRAQLRAEAAGEVSQG